MEQPAQIITVADLKKYYTVGPNTVKALDGVSLDVKSGEFVGVMGRSGSGKSTLLNMLAGLESPTDGFLEIDGEPVGILSERKRIQFRRNSIGFVFQSYNLMPQYTTLENVALPLAIRGVSKRVRDELAEEALYRVGLQDNLRHRPSELSGGEQQRVGIARAIIAKPPIVLADEPTGNLDSKTTKEVMHMIRGFAKRFHQTIVLVSHDPEMTEYADRIVTLIDGRIVSNVENQVKAEIDAAPYIE